MKQEDIARIAHEINRAYCASLGDDSQVAWEDAEDWQKQSVLAGVAMHVANPDATPEQSHESWLKQKLADGWKYGEAKDAEAKTHPCCVPYDELPQEQKSKDYLFKAVVAALRDIPDADDAVAEALANVVVSDDGSGGIPVEYIGRREVWRDTLYRTKLSFVKGQVRSLPHDIAAKLLRHSDIFRRGKAKSAKADNTAEQLKQAAQVDADRERQRIAFEIIDQVNQINNKKSLAEFAAQRLQLNMKVEQRTTLADMRKDIADHVERFGVV